MGPPKEPLSLLYKAFLSPLLTHASPGWFPFLSVTNITKLECFHGVTSHVITGCLSSSTIPLFLCEASLHPQPVTLTHFTLSSYERTFHLPTSFFISGLARLGVKPRLFRSSWIAFSWKAYSKQKLVILLQKKRGGGSRWSCFIFCNKATNRLNVEAISFPTV